MNSLKAAILGTQHPDVQETEREILLAAGTEGLQRLAGYTATKMPIDKPTFPPLAEKFVALSDIILHAIYGETAHNNNPRVPYLVLIWLLIGTSNNYRLSQHLVDDLRLRQVGGTLLRIVIGDAKYNHRYTRLMIRRILNNWNKSKPKDFDLFEQMIHHSMRSLLKAFYLVEFHFDYFNYSALLGRIESALHNPFMMTDAMRLELRKCVEKWQCLPDAELLQIMSQLMLDILFSSNDTA